ncbi:hypothetical protein TCAL_16840 [Tigriopus californicus]|uniref:Uncharacterized protein n=1 Tax=Tigriopus californicus TaxID=6832 RepID=A0A553PE01_TIGCA|nr:hypothetical protein TCAL_16840 [Tigriopus californicus]
MNSPRRVLTSVIFIEFSSTIARREDIAVLWSSLASFNSVFVADVLDKSDSWLIKSSALDLNSSKSVFDSSLPSISSSTTLPRFVKSPRSWDKILANVGNLLLELACGAISFVFKVDHCQFQFINPFAKILISLALLHVGHHQVHDLFLNTFHGGIHELLLPL